jgi:hypothetical protein
MNAAAIGWVRGYGGRPAGNYSSLMEGTLLLPARGGWRGGLYSWAGGGAGREAVKPPTTRAGEAEASLRLRLRLPLRLRGGCRVRGRPCVDTAQWG